MRTLSVVQRSNAVRERERGEEDSSGADLQAAEESGGGGQRKVQLSLLALLEESVQVGVLLGNTHTHWSWSDTQWTPSLEERTPPTEFHLKVGRPVHKV